MFSKNMCLFTVCCCCCRWRQRSVWRQQFGSWSLWQLGYLWSPDTWTLTSTPWPRQGLRAVHIISYLYQLQLNLVDPNTVYPNYSVFRSVLSGPVFYPSYFNLKITRWTELKHPNFSVFRIENLGSKFMFSTHDVIFESKCNLAPSWLAQMTLLHLKIVFAHLQWHPIKKLG